MGIDVSFDSEERDLQVLVGFDGSDQSRLALHFAAVEAQARGATLTVVTAFTVPTEIYTNISSIPSVPESQARREAAEKVLTEAAEYLTDYPGKVEYKTAEGNAAGMLVKLSERAQLAVVGARGRGGFVGRILGSVATALPAHAHCPTVVVPDDYDPGTGSGAELFTREGTTAPVVTGFDGSDQSQRALLVAAQYAERRQAPLKVLVVIPILGEMLNYWYPDLTVPQTSIEERRIQLKASVEKETAWLADRFPSVEATVSVVVGDTTELFEKETQEAQLAVLGSRGRGTVRSALLGSVSRGVLLAANGPVMVVPGKG